MIGAVIAPSPIFQINVLSPPLREPPSALSPLRRSVGATGRGDPPRQVHVHDDAAVCAKQKRRRLVPRPPLRRDLPPLPPHSSSHQFRPAPLPNAGATGLPLVALPSDAFRGLWSQRRSEGVTTVAQGKISRQQQRVANSNNNNNNNNPQHTTTTTTTTTTTHNNNNNNNNKPRIKTFTCLPLTVSASAYRSRREWERSALRRDSAVHSAVASSAWAAKAAIAEA